MAGFSLLESVGSAVQFAIFPASSANHLVDRW